MTIFGKNPGYDNFLIPYPYRAGPGVRAKSCLNDPISRSAVILYACDAALVGIFGPISGGREYELADGNASLRLYFVRLPIEYFSACRAPCGWQTWLSYRPGPGV